MKRFLIPILAALMLLAACQPTPESEFVVMKDTERLVETVQAKNPEESAIPTTDEMIDNALEKTDQHYTYSYTSQNERLHIIANADVYTPKTGKLPMARVKAGVLTDEFAKTIFDKVFQGRTVYVDYYNQSIPSTKAQIAEMIAYYQDLIDTGRTEDKMMDEEEALEFIEELKKEYETAPEEAVIPELDVSDGTMLYREMTDSIGIERYYELNAANKDVGWLIVRRPAEDDGGFDYWLSYNRGSNDERISWTEDEDGRVMDFGNGGDYTSHVLNASDTAYEYGQTLSPSDAVQLCIDFLKDLGITDVMPHPAIDAYTLNSGSNCYYIIDFVRTVNGTQVAYLSSLQGWDRSESLPWDYESIRFEVDREGIIDLIWQSPTEMTKIESNDAAVLTYEQALETFETMSKIIYEAQTEMYDVPKYIDLYISRIELDLVRVREKDAPGRFGLYVPAWVFYGKSASEYNAPVPAGAIDHKIEKALLIVNAVDGSIIDLDKGY